MLPNPSEAVFNRLTHSVSGRGLRNPCVTERGLHIKVLPMSGEDLRLTHVTWGILETEKSRIQFIEQEFSGTAKYDEFV